MRWWTKRHDAEIDREIRAHLDAEAEEQRSGGLSPEEARYAGRRLFGNPSSIKEQVREATSWTSAEVLARDFLYAFRATRKHPGLAITAILTLALGIGANTAIFSIMDAVLFRPLPYPAAGQLFRIWQSEPRLSQRHLGTAPPEFAAYRDRTRTFSSVAGYQPASFDVTSNDAPEHITGCRATADLFPTLGARPLIGRTFTVDTGRFAVLSYAYWQRHYAADPHVAGTVIRLNEQPYEIIGVMPAWFTFPSTPASPGEPPALWTPLSFSPDELQDWASSFDTAVIARLRDGVSSTQARDDVRRVVNEFQQDHRDIYAGNIVMDAAAEPWAPEFGERVPLVLDMLAGAVVFVLLIACANVANLLLARTAMRKREISIRRALGASPMRLMRQVFLETAILAIAGGAAGCAVGYGLLGAIRELWTSQVNLAAANLDYRVLLFTLGLCGVTCLFCGLAPAWTARRPDINDSLKQSSNQAGSKRQRRVGRVLVFAEMAFSVVLLIGASLLFRSLMRVLETPLGFDPEHALIVRTEFNRQRYASADRRRAAEQAIVARLRALPGVAAATLTTHVPLADERQIGFHVDGAPPDDVHWADNALVSGDYFRVMGIPLIRGRSFSDALDTPQSPAVGVINQSMRLAHWPGRDPIGQMYQWGGRHITVVGVVGDVHVEGLDKPVGPMIYNPVYQTESGATSNAVFVLRTAGGDPMRLARAAQGAIWSVDRGLPILGTGTLHEVVAASLNVRRSALSLAGTFALLAVILALIGVYGVISNAAAQRTREMAVRMALGARPIEITRLVLGEGVRLGVWGIAAGVVVSMAAGALISKLLFGVRAIDPISYIFGSSMLLTVSLLAAYIPARRAARHDPAAVLRNE
jgi:putative ABC transport system permease protein